MKRILILMMVLGLVFGSIATAEAGKKKKKKKPAEPVRVERVVELEYSCPCGINTPVGGPGFKLDGLTGENIGGGTFALGADDVYLTAEAVDSSGQKIWVSLNQDTDGDGFNNDVGSFCGATTEPLEVSRAEAVYRVFISGSGTCDDGTPILGTSGVITFTLSNLP